MKFEQIASCSMKEFRRLTGVKKFTFDKMVEILTSAHSIKKSKGGRPNKLSIENMLLMTLEYLREYRTYLSTGKNFEISESNAFETIKWVESILVKDPNFRLPGKKVLLQSDNEIEVILIDATESPVQRPKKSKEKIIQEKRKNIPSKVRSL